MPSIILSTGDRVDNIFAMTWMVLSPCQIHMLYANAQCDSTRREALWEMIKSWGGALINGIKTVVKDTPQSPQLPSTVLGWNKRPWLQQGRGPSPERDQAGASRAVRYQFLSFTSHPVCGALLQQLEQIKTWPYTSYVDYSYSPLSPSASSVTSQIGACALVKLIFLKLYFHGFFIFSQLMLLSEVDPRGRLFTKMAPVWGPHSDQWFFCSAH